MDEEIKILIDEIKKKKSISDVKDSFILKEIEKILAQDKKIREKLQTADLLKVSKSAEFKQAVKQVRAVLHRSHGQYQTDNLEKRKKYLAELKEMMAATGRDTIIRAQQPVVPAARLPAPTTHPVEGRKKKLIDDEKIKELHDKILSTNVSAKERIDIYPMIYQEIFAITGIPKSILDLGSGINPVSLPYMNLERVRYTALELSRKDCDFLVQYFTLMSDYVDGNAEPIDLVEIKKNPDLLARFEADVAFIFKVIEPIELSKSHKIGEEIIGSLNCKWIIVSFATKTISGKAMNHPRRGWFEQMLRRLGHEFKMIEKENEIFYIIKKQ